VQLVCVSCNTAFAGHNKCPRCGERLVAPQEVQVAQNDDFAPRNQTVDPTTTNRIMSGAAVAFGIIFGTRELVNGGLSLAGEADNHWSQTYAGMGTVFVIRVLAGLLSGCLAGAGRANSFNVGAMAGAVGCATWIGLNMFAYKQSVSIFDGISFLFLIIASSFAAIIAESIWPPRTDLPVASHISKGSSILKRVMTDKQEDKVPETNWIRVIVAVCITVCGFATAELVRNWLTQGGFIDLGGKNNIPTSSMIIASIIAFFAAGYSGASTGIGFRQGVFTGLLSGAIAAFAFMSRSPQTFAAAAGLMDLMGWPIEKAYSQQTAGAIFGVCFIIGTFGGSFGSILLPPVKKGGKKKRKMPEGQAVYAE
jgi:hypothetical protein